jgi:hypothetical protein
MIQSSKNGLYLELPRTNVKAAIMSTVESISHLEGRVRVAKRFNGSSEFYFGTVVGCCSRDFKYVRLDSCNDLFYVVCIVSIHFDRFALLMYAVDPI